MAFELANTGCTDRTPSPHIGASGRTFRLGNKSTVWGLEPQAVRVTHIRQHIILHISVVWLLCAPHLIIYDRNVGHSRPTEDTSTRPRTGVDCTTYNTARSDDPPASWRQCAPRACLSKAISFRPHNLSTEYEIALPVEAFST